MREPVIDAGHKLSHRLAGHAKSEELLGRWIRSRGIGDEITVATKLGARPNAPSSGFSLDIEGLSAKTIRESAERSRERLGIERIHLLGSAGKA